MPIRSGCQDVWNAFMCEGAKYSSNDIPLCPTTAETLPAEIIPWDEAKHIYKTALARGNAGFVHPAFVCFYLDDQKFDGLHGIWHDSTHALKILRHFAGAITPDFSTYQDFPEPIKIYNTYRMRAFGYWLGRNGIPVFNNVRWAPLNPGVTVGTGFRRTASSASAPPAAVRKACFLRQNKIERFRMKGRR